MLALYTLLLTAVPSADAPNLLLQKQQLYRQAAAVAGPCVVRIATAGGIEKVDEVFRGSGPTTGLIVAADGWVVSSSFNLAHKPAGILVALADGRRLPARVVSTDSSRQLVLLKVDANDLPVPTAIPVDSTEPGQTALALGRTWDVESPSISAGIISAVGRVWGRALQTDAKVSPVNYGGPLIDVQGRVYGVLVPMSPDSELTTAGYEWYDSGIGFAVPLEDVLKNLDRWKEGDLRRGLLGVEFAQENIYEGTPTVKSIAWKSPAAEAGILRDDQILEVDGQPISRYAQFKHALGPKYADEKVTLGVKRGEERLSIDVELVGELPVYRRVWMGVLPAADSEGAVAIEHIFADSPAAKAGLTKEHQIVGIDGKPVANAAELEKSLSDRLIDDSVALRIKDDKGERDLAIDLVAFPSEVPKDTPTVAPGIHPDGEGETKTGLFRGHKAWIYRPQGFADASPTAPGVLILLPKAGTPEFDGPTDDWKNFAQTYHLAVAALKPRGEDWQQPDLQTIATAIADVRSDVKAVRNRTIIAAQPKLAGLAAMAYRLDPANAGGVVVAGPTRLQAPAPHPDRKVAFYTLWSEKDPKKNAFTKLLDAAAEEGHVIFRAPYPAEPAETIPANALDGIGQWSLLLHSL